MKNYLSLINFETGGPRCDVTPLFEDADAFEWLLNELAAPYRHAPLNLVAAIDALGFVLGAGLARELHKGLVLLRKGGKLPVECDVVEFVDYTGQTKSLELRQGALYSGARILLVDEWIETGAQARAAIQLIEGQGGVVAGIATLNMDDNELTRYLRQNYPSTVILG